MAKKSKEEMMAALTGEHKEQKREIAKRIENITLTHDAEEDYNEVRKLLKDLMGKSGTALDELLALAQQSEHPRVFEVLAGLIKTASEVGGQLVDLQKQRHELDKLNNPDKVNNSLEGASTTNVFIGSTDELQKLIKQERTVIDVDAE